MRTVRNVLGILGLAVAFFGVLIACSRLREAYGHEAVFVVYASLAAAWVATEESRAMTLRVRKVFAKIGLSIENAARQMRMDLPQLSRQLNNQEQLSLSRLAQLDADYHLWFALETLEADGRYFAHKNANIARLLEKVEALPMPSIAHHTKAVA